MALNNLLMNIFLGLKISKKNNLPDLILLLLKFFHSLVQALQSEYAYQTMMISEKIRDTKMLIWETPMENPENQKKSTLTLTMLSYQLNTINRLYL